ncbi:S-adenosyl-L-methionine-dependent methyltransferase [Aureobasidium pullulans]|uniref:type I protein arginine methyltransferase n=1 Tax=Aureobasidium pullulans TaxID=5580 RepID=A0A4S9K6M1_AURPU|nr:S-adenosyl-L-methionine-dependent methyltransferase [Aureobasidium pullulans]
MVRDDIDSSDASSTSSIDELLREDSEGWEDAEPEENEDIQVKDFFSDKTFPDAASMIKYAAEQHNFDFLKITKDFGLDFFGAIKFVNYIRGEAKNGNQKPDVSSKSLFEDDKYMQPALEDDALLFSLDDVLDSEDAAGQDLPIGSSGDKTAELEAQLARLREQFAEYKLTVEKTLDDRWNEPSKEGEAGSSKTKNENHQDPGYFDSYSYNDIHQTMLQDTVRTDAYRDFIYANKHLFAGKTVLDVGCGTGILSLFCAKAGAARVIAVDNSEIINKARANIAMNGQSKVITCVRGKIEEIQLPDGIEKVDIIVSEWMGYCLLYEAMLDSVLYARDRYLKPDGLMVPSHCTMHLAPLADQDWISDNITFWRDVYGFDMTSMMEKIYEDTLVRYPNKDTIVGRSTDELPFKVLDLHTVTVADLDFTSDVSFTLNKDIDNLDGFCTWFDTLFLQSRKDEIPAGMLRGVKPPKSDDDKTVFFTTGPFGPETHWRCGVLMIDATEKDDQALKQGTVISGNVTFKKNKDAKRNLNISMNWEIKGAETKDKQLWYMR